MFSVFAAASLVSETTFALRACRRQTDHRDRDKPLARCAVQLFKPAKLLGVRADVFAQPRNLVDERDGKPEKRFRGVFPISAARCA